MLNAIRLFLWAVVAVLCLFYARVFLVIRQKEKESRRRAERRRKRREPVKAAGNEKAQMP